MKRPLLISVGLALAGSVLTAGPAPAAGAKDATLTWKISECAFTACPSLTQAQSVTGNATRTDDGWRFTGGTGTHDAGTGATRVAFAGSLTIGNTAMGGYSISFRDPVVSVDADGAGSLQADVAYRTSGSSPEVVVQDVKVVDLPNVPDATSWTVTPPWENVGTPGVPAPVDGKQFAQPLIDALPASLRGWFWATGTTGSNLTKNPSPVAVSLATAPEVSITGAENLKVNQSATITVKGSGFDPAKRTDAVQGLYVVFGPDAAVVGYNDPDVFGAAQYLPVAPDAQGNFTTELTIKGRYTDSSGKSWDGTKQTLGVSTWAAHSHAITDWDTFTPISFTPAEAVAAKAKAVLVDRRVSRGQRAVLKVKVRSEVTPTGKVRVKSHGRVIAEKKLKAKSEGVIRIRLPKLKPGKHRLKAVYLGNAEVQRAVSDKVVLRVRR